MTEPEEKPQEGLESLYVREKYIEKKIMGVLFKIRDISGEQFMKLTSECVEKDGKTIIPELYIPKLIKAAVVSPEIDISRLSVKAYTEIGAMLESELGLKEIARKNSINR